MSLLLNQFGAPLHGGRDSFVRVRGQGVLGYLAHQRNAYDGSPMRSITGSQPSYEWLSVNGERFLRPNGGALDTTNVGWKPSRIIPAYDSNSAFLARIYCHQSTSEGTKPVILVTNGTGSYGYGVRSGNGTFQVLVNAFWFAAKTKTVGAVYTVAGWMNGQFNGCFTNEDAVETRYSSGSSTVRSIQITVGDGWGNYTAQDFGVSLLWVGIGHYTETMMREIARDPYRYLFPRDEPFYTAAPATGAPTLSQAQLIDIGATTARPRVYRTF